MSSLVVIGSPYVTYAHYMSSLVRIYILTIYITYMNFILGECRHVWAFGLFNHFIPFQTFNNDHEYHP